MQSPNATAKKSTLELLIVCVIAFLIGATCVLSGCTPSPSEENKNTAQSAYNAVISAEATMLEMDAKKTLSEQPGLTDDEKSELATELAAFDAELPEKMSVLDGCKDSVDAMDEKYNDVKSAFLNVYNATNAFATDLSNGADAETLYNDDQAIQEGLASFAEACKAAGCPVTE